MAKAKLIGMPWDFSSLFDDAVRSLPERAMIKRDCLWASELQMDCYSRYLRMHAHPMSNPPTIRSRRKFIIGHIIEWIVGFILTMCGILKAKQLRGEVQLPGLLKVSGKLDYIAGGEVIDWEKQRLEVKKMQMLFASAMDDMPPIIMHAVERIFCKMEMMFKLVPLQEYIMEVKSCAAYVMDILEASNKPRPRHVLQPVHYLLANKDIQSAQLIYISKDDAIIKEFIVTRERSLLKIYKDDVSLMTDYYNASGANYLKNLPPKEKELIFEDDSFTFQKNMNVQYSNYLTMGWGYKDWEDFEKQWAPKKESFNRVFRRHVLEGQTMYRKSAKTGEPQPYTMKLTPDNMKKIDEATILFPQWDKYVQLARKAGAFQKPEENEED